MGYISGVKIDVSGPSQDYFEIEKNYFNVIDGINDDFLSDCGETVCINKEEFQYYGKLLWRWLNFEIDKNKIIHAHFEIREIKWGYFDLQWQLLSRTLIQKEFEWRFERNGQEENDVEIQTSKEISDKFNMSKTE